MIRLTRFFTLAGIILLLAGVSRWAAAEPSKPVFQPETPGAGQNVELLGQIGGDTYAVAVEGNYAYIGVGPRLVILDVSNPSAPTEIGQSAVMPYVVQDVAVAGSYAYVADQYAGLRVINVANPASPVEVGVHDTPGNAQGVAVAGSYAYVADDTAGLQVISVSNPASPVGVGVYDTPGIAQDVAVAGNYVYVGDWQGGLRVISVANPASPVEVGAYVTPGDAWGVTVVGTTVYLADVGGGLRVISVANPANPVELGFYDTPGTARGVAVVGLTAYVGDGQSGLRVISVANPASPAEIGFLNMPVGAFNVAVIGSTAYVTNWIGLQVINVANPVTPEKVGTYITPGHATGVAVTGSTAYLTNSYFGLHVVSIANPASLVELGAYETPGHASDVAVVGGYAYVADGSAGLRVISVANPANPVEVGAFDTPGNASSVAVVGSYAYVADYSAGLRVINVANPASPMEVGFYDTPGDASGVAVAGGYAYVSDWSALRVISVANPANPVEVGSWANYSSISGVAIAGSIAYLADWNSGLYAVSVANPTYPVYLGYYRTPRYATRLAVSGTIAYVTTGPGGVFVLRYTGGDSTPTPTATATSTFAPTPTPTSDPTPASTPTPTATSGTAPDDYEPDNTCGSANALASDGTGQNHTFHGAGDVDWVRFQATAGTRYVIAGRHTGPLADVMAWLYNSCGDPNPVQDDDFGNDTILTWTAPATEMYYLRLANHDPNIFGADVSYQVSVRVVSTGAAIVVGGRLYNNEQLQPQITFMTNHAYQVFQQAGYDHDDIYYLSADPVPPANVDAPSLAATLQYAITAWAPGHTIDGDPLYIYLGDHGQRELFYLDTGSQVATTAQLETWLLAFENQRPNSPVVLIVEACYSGSFITPLQTLARPGRVLVSATGDNNLSYVRPAGEGGAYFSDALFDALGQSYSLWDSYQLAQQAVRAAQGNLQTPWIDGDGDGLPYPQDTDDAGAGRNLGLGRPSGFAGQAPYIEPPAVPRPAGTQPVQIVVQVLDEHRPSTSAWMMVTKPSTPPPSPPPGYTTPVSHAQRVNLVYNPANDRFEVTFTFAERGVYQFEFYARDATDQQAQSVVSTVRNGSRVLLPVILK